MSNTATQATTSQTTASNLNTLSTRNFPGLAINDNSMVTDNILINENGRLENIAIDLDISHTYIGDLLVTITSPDNRVMRLHARSGQATDNILTTYPTLTTPQDDLANLRGISIFGTWKLTIRDMGVGDIGTFNSWQLNLFYSNVILDTTSRSTTPPPSISTQQPVSITTQDECGVTFFNQNSRIVGGNEANPGSWPASAYIIFRYTKTITVNGFSFAESTGSICGGNDSLNH